jgi:hypothetical protein
MFIIAVVSCVIVPLTVVVVYYIGKPRKHIYNLQQMREESTMLINIIDTHNTNAKAYEKDWLEDADLCMTCPDKKECPKAFTANMCF